MSYIPNCRTDDVFNEKNLSETNKAFVMGYDFAVEEIIAFFDAVINADAYPEVQRLLENNNAEQKAEIFVGAVEDWLEMSRNQAIVSLIEEQA